MTIKIPESLRDMIASKVADAYPTIDIVEAFGGQDAVNAAYDRSRDIDKQDERPEGVDVEFRVAPPVYKPIHIEKDIDGYVAVTCMSRQQDRYSSQFGGRTISDNVEVVTFVIREDVLTMDPTASRYDEPYTVSDSCGEFTLMTSQYGSSKSRVDSSKLTCRIDTCRGLYWDTVNGTNNDNSCGGELFTEQYDTHNVRADLYIDGDVATYDRTYEGETVEDKDWQKIFLNKRLEMKNHTRQYYFKAFCRASFPHAYPTKPVPNIVFADVRKMLDKNGNATANSWQELSTFIAIHTCNAISNAIDNVASEASLIVSDYKIQVAEQAAHKAFDKSVPALVTMALASCDNNLCEVLPHFDAICEVNKITNRGWTHRISGSYESSKALEDVGCMIRYEIEVYPDRDKGVIEFSAKCSLSEAAVMAENKRGDMVFLKRTDRDNRGINSAIGESIKDDYTDRVADAPVETGEAMISEITIVAKDVFSIHNRRFRHDNFQGMADMINNAIQMQMSMQATS